MYLWFSTHFRLAWQKLRYCKITDYQEKFARTIKSYMSQAALLQCLPIRRNSSGSYHLDIYLGGKFFFLKRVTSLKPLAQRPLSIIENRPSVQVYSSIQICSVYWTTLNLPEVKNKMWGSITVFELGKQTLNRVFENENLWPIKKILGNSCFPYFHGSAAIVKSTKSKLMSQCRTFPTFPWGNSRTFSIVLKRCDLFQA